MSEKYRVGILGTENSHAMAFTKIINLPDENGRIRYPDFRVTALYAADRKCCEAITAECGDIEICDSVEAMAGKVDCVMVTARHGKYHLPFAMPFIERGCPAFIDKPFTISSSDAQELIRAAEKSGSPLCGGSGCKYSHDIIGLRDELNSGKYGRITSAVLNFPADMESEYGGFYFYASHLIEMTTALLGYNIETVTAFEKNGCLTAVAGYPSFNAIMNFVKNGRYYAVVYCEKDIIIREISIANIYNYETEHFIEMVRTGKAPLTAGQLTAPVYIMNAIERSLKSGAAETV